MHRAPRRIGPQYCYLYNFDLSQEFFFCRKHVIFKETIMIDILDPYYIFLGPYEYMTMKFLPNW
jgi:hypothetical protein